jgi:hypothetical protein
MAPVDDEQQIREVVDRWVVARDAGHWEALLDCWHDDGRMRATWFTGTAVEFVERVAAAFEAGVLVHHFLGGTMVEQNGDRAIAQTKMVIANRTSLDGVECDLSCFGRFYDYFERRGERWAIVLRQPIYEKDRLDVVVPGAVLEVDTDELERFPPGCRWLLWTQERSGLPVITEQPGLRGPLVEQVYRDGAAWLAGAPAPAD